MGRSLEFALPNHREVSGYAENASYQLEANRRKMPETSAQFPHKVGSSNRTSGVRLMVDRSGSAAIFRQTIGRQSAPTRVLFPALSWVNMTLSWNAYREFDMAS